MLADCWLVGGLVFFYCKIETKNWLTCLDQLADCVAVVSPPCLAGRWSVDQFGPRDWENVCWLLVGWWLGVFFSAKSRLNNWLACLEHFTDCMAHAGESKHPIAERTPSSWVWNVQSRNKTYRIIMIGSHFSEHRRQDTVWIQSYLIP